jgi:hypothetical protein
MLCNPDSSEAWIRMRRAGAEIIPSSPRRRGPSDSQAIFQSPFHFLPSSPRNLGRSTTACEPLARVALSAIGLCPMAGDRRSRVLASVGHKALGRCLRGNDGTLARMTHSPFPATPSR